MLFISDFFWLIFKDYFFNLSNVNEPLVVVSALLRLPHATGLGFTWIIPPGIQIQSVSVNSVLTSTFALETGDITKFSAW